MRIITAFLVTAALVAGVVVIMSKQASAQPASTWSVADINERLAKQAERACIFPVGGWTIVDCSAAAAAQSGQLNQWSRYVVQCGDDSYFATGDQSTDEADSSDGWIPSGAWVEFMTTDTVRYFSCKNKNSDSDCRYLECK